MNRRDFLRSASIVSAGLAFPETARLFAEETSSNGWRTFEVTTHVEVLKPWGATRIWLPVPLTSTTPFQRTLANKFTAEGGAAKLVESNADALGIVTAEFPAGVKPTLTLQSRVATKSIAVDLSAPVKAPKADRAELEHYLRSTKALADRRHREGDGNRDHQRRDDRRREGARDLRMDRRQYVPRSETRGCGIGDIRFMLESRDLGGKCADLNALYVGLARASGLPARDAYGIRVAKSELGYKASAPLPKTSRRRNIAGLRCTSAPMDGSLSIPRTSERSCWKNRRETGRWTTRW